MAEKKNYYEILGVKKDATEEEIKAAYKRLVKQYHPDLHPGDSAAAEKFKEINEANEILSDKQKRAAYDYESEHPGMGGMGGMGGGFNGAGFSGFGDIFETIFGGMGGMGGMGGGAARDDTGDDVRLSLDLSFMDAAKGCRRELSYQRNVECPSCRGTGAKGGTALKTCQNCGGKGEVRFVQDTLFGRQIRIGVCPDCKGKGKIVTDKCPDCRGKGVIRKDTKVTLDIPAGVDTSSMMRKRGFGQAGENGGQPGDLIITFRIEPHKIFRREGFELFVDLPVPFLTAALGGSVKVPDLNDAFDFTIPEGTQPGTEFTVRGKGIKGRSGTGSLHIRVQVEVPSRLSREQKKSLEQAAETLDFKNFELSRKYSDSLSALYGKEAYKKS